MPVSPVKRYAVVPLLFLGLLTAAALLMRGAGPLALGSAVLATVVLAPRIARRRRNAGYDRHRDDEDE